MNCVCRANRVCQQQKGTTDSKFSVVIGRAAYINNQQVRFVNVKAERPAPQSCRHMTTHHVIKSCQGGQDQGVLHANDNDMYMTP